MELANTQGDKIRGNKQMHCEPSFVDKAEDYKYSSAKNYSNKKGLVEVLYI
jgi:hypothetical protein